MSSKDKHVRVAVVGMGIGRPNGAALSRNARGKVVLLNVFWIELNVKHHFATG